MALKDGSTRYTMFSHAENGKEFHRRIHRIEIQAKHGHLYHLEGDNLPDSIHTNAGVGFKDCHTMEILVPEWQRIPRTPQVARPFFRPTTRDVVYLVMGSVLPIVASGLIALLSAAF
jgi:hypothetical protein